MYTGSTDQSIPELQLALESSSETSRFRTLLLIFWGMILSKCFVLEYAVQAYNIPINSTLYVWTLSITMATVVTGFHFQARNLGLRGFGKITSRLNRHIWLSAGVGALLLAIPSIGFSLFSPLLLPGLMAILLGGAFFLHASLTRRKLFLASALGWWAISIPLLIQSGLRNLLLFGIAIFLLQVVPATVLWFRAHRDYKRTLESADFSI